MKIKTKLLGAILVVIVIFVVGNIFTITKINLMQKTVNDIDQNQLPSVVDIGNLNMYVSDVPRLVEAYVLEQDANKKVDINNQLNDVLDSITKTRKHYENYISSPEERQLYVNFSKNWDAFNNQIPAIIADGKVNNLGAANKKIWDAYSSWTEANNILDNITTLTMKDINKATQDSIAASRMALKFSIILSLIASIVGLVTAFLLSNSMARALAILQSAATKIADGNLTEQIVAKSKDEFGELAKVFNKMTIDLRGIVKEVIDTASSLGASSEELSAAAEEASASSEQVSATITQLAAGATDQAKSVEDTGVVINQISSNSQQVAANAKAVSQSSGKAAEAAKLGALQAENAVRKIEEIREVSDQTAEAIFQLGDQSKQIGQIVDVIQAIADQTNLLALNAAIEAARAGEQGRGFAVVAEEVRKLAEQSSSSTKQIATLIGNIQRETERAIGVMEKGKVEVAAGVEAVNLAGTSFQTIVAEINTVVDQIQQISVATQQMAGGTIQAVKAIDSIGIIAEQNAASTQEVSAASEEQAATMTSVSQSAEMLAQLGESLTRLVAKFEV